MKISRKISNFKIFSRELKLKYVKFPFRCQKPIGELWILSPFFRKFESGMYCVINSLGFVSSNVMGFDYHLFIWRYVFAKYLLNRALMRPIFITHTQKKKKKKKEEKLTKTMIKILLRDVVVTNENYKMVYFFTAYLPFWRGYTCGWKINILFNLQKNRLQNIRYYK